MAYMCNVTVTFHCHFTGDDPESVVWKRHQGGNRLPSIPPSAHADDICL